MTRLSMRAAGCLQHGAQIVEDLPGLRFDIAFADDVAVFVGSGLAGDEEQLAAAVQNPLAIARPRIVEVFG